MLIPRHLLCVIGVDQPTAHESVQDAFAGMGLHLGDGRVVQPADRMKGHARWGIAGLIGGLRDAVRLVTIATRHGLKHPIDRAAMKFTCVFRLEPKRSFSED